jgi:hypothetical protein
VWQLGVVVESGFIFPAGVNVEESRILDCTEGIDGEAPVFLPGWSQNFLNSRRDCILPVFLSMKAGEDEEF